MYERFSPHAAQSAALAQAQFVETADALPADPIPFVPVTAEQPDAAGQNTEPADGALSALAGIFKNLAGRLHLRDLSADDLLLLGILILILRKNAEWDVLLIMAVLFFLGMFDSAKT